MLAVVVCVGWAGNLVAGFVGWQSDPGVNAIMGALLALVATIGGKSLFNRPDEGLEPEQDEPRPLPRAGRHRRETSPATREEAPGDER